MRAETTSAPLADPPAYAMTASRYVRDTIAISVYPEMRAGRMCLTCADDEARTALDNLLRRACDLAGASLQAQAQARAKVGALFDTPFDDDVWYSQAPGLPPVVFVKKTAIEGVMSLQDAVLHAHQVQVAHALSEGRPVPAAVCAEYRAMLDPERFDREVSP